MQIEWNDNINKVPFEYVDIGSTFMLDADIYMRIYSVEDNDTVYANAVNIENGSVITFYDDEYVLPVVGKFVMES